MTKRLGILLVSAAVLAAIAFALRGPIALRVMPPLVERILRTDSLADLPDGLHLLLCGAGSPLADPNRSGPCVAVMAGKTLVVVDAGTGGVRNLQRMRVRVGDIAAVLLTHFHSDHIDGLGEMGLLRWVPAAHTSPLPVYGPEGVEQVVAGFNQAYRLDAGYRTAHHGAAVAPPSGAGLSAFPFTVPDDGSPFTVLEEDGLTIAAFRVEHDPVSPAVGYRFEYGGRALVISGDTAKSRAVEEAARGADLLVHEALDARMVAIMNQAADAVGNANLARVTHDIPSYHTTPVEAAEVAAASGVEALLFYHIVPALPLPGLEAAFVQGVGAVYGGEVVLGRDGTLVSLPSSGEAIAFSNLL